MLHKRGGTRTPTSNSGSNSGHVSLRSLSPGVVLSARFIVLAHRRSDQDHSGSNSGRSSHIWVADETGSATLALQGFNASNASLMEEGDIFVLQHGQATLDEDKRIFLELGRNGKLERDGFLTLSFQENPDVSAVPWAPATSQRSSIMPENNAGNDSSSAGPGHRCFLCDDRDHTVLECEYREQGVVVTCRKLELENHHDARLQRVKLIEKALEEAGYPMPKQVRWFKKTPSKPGALYMRMTSEFVAAGLIATKELKIDGEKAFVFRISETGTAKKRLRTEDQEKQKPSLKKSKVLSCILCGSVEHVAYSCPYWRHSVRIVGAVSTEAEAVTNMLKERNSEPQSVTWIDSKEEYWVRLGSARQARQTALSAQKGVLVLDGRRLSCYPFTGDPSVAKVAAAAPGMQPVKLRSKHAVTHTGHAAEEAADGTVALSGQSSSLGEASVEAPKGKDRFTENHLKRKVCFLCGEADHELPDCPARAECVLICREWGSETSASKLGALNEALCDILRESEFQVVRSYWHRRVCYLRLGSAEQASKLVALSAGSPNNFIVLGEALKIRMARSTRRSGAPSSVAVEEEEVTEVTEQTDATVEAEISDGPCPLCGSAEHALSSCDLRSKSLRLSCASFKVSHEAAEKEISRAASSSSSTGSIEGLRWHGDHLFVIMPCAEDAMSFMEVAAGEGLEIGGEMVSVELTSSIRKSSKGIGKTRSAGLRPEAIGQKGRVRGPRTKVHGIRKAAQV
eukprot:TRINITY_DN39344_c0_g1_i1.p1 TRINITY_DN39344_c0_g1~~TRINITY_DN39344_c0_g1_i1.p1  ORF type:complete len:741 (-),score=137.46 TRINITY_DN39344_c0_g1_i1:194-2416(-)